MAGGKENARQKMINLMYLVFIAMLALNMSKEVLMTFGEIDREVTKSSKSIKTHAFYQQLLLPRRRRDEESFRISGPALRRHVSRTRTASPRPHARTNRNRNRNRFPGSAGSDKPD